MRPDFGTAVIWIVAYVATLALVLGGLDACNALLDAWGG